MKTKDKVFLVLFITLSLFTFDKGLQKTEQIECTTWHDYKVESRVGFKISPLMQEQCNRYGIQL